MSKEKVFIVLSHKHSLKKGTSDEWEVTETVEFVNQLRNKHTTMSTAIGDYVNQKMLSGSRVGMGEYEKFDTYIRKKYAKQLDELDKAYGRLQAPAPVSALITDEFGNLRLRTVFDAA
jgi:hypothetical protein